MAFEIFATYVSNCKRLWYGEYLYDLIEKITRGEHHIRSAIENRVVPQFWFRQRGQF